MKMVLLHKLSGHFRDIKGLNDFLQELVQLHVQINTANAKKCLIVFGYTADLTMC